MGLLKPSIRKIVADFSAKVTILAKFFVNNHNVGSTSFYIEDWEVRMFRFIGILILLFFVYATTGCGGGTDISTNQVIDQIRVQLMIGQEKKATLGQANLTFPADTGGDVIVTETKAGRIPQPAFQPTQPVMTMDFSANPIKPFTIDYPDNPTGTPVAVALSNGQPIGTFPAERVNGRLVVTVNPTLLASAAPSSRGFSLTVSFVLGLATLKDPPDAGYGLKLVATSATNDKTIIFVHGLLQSADGVKDGLLKARDLGNYGRAYSFCYDYRKPISEAGGQLAQAINAAGFNPKSADIIGYSKGGLVALWALTQSGVTKPIRRTILMSAPIQGCDMSLTALYYVFGRIFSVGIISMPFFGIHDNCLEELLPGSDCLNQLGHYTYNQKGDVDIYAFGSDGDDVVNASSGRGDSTNLENLTNGRVVRETLSGFGHMTMDSPEAIGAAFSKIKGGSNGLQVESDAAVVNWDGSWSSYLTIINNTSQTVRVETTEFEEFERHSNWQGNFWLNPDYPAGEFFPHERHDLGEEVVLGPGESRTFDIGYWPDETRTPVWDVPENLQAKTSHIICQGSDATGTTYKATYDLAMGYNGATPEPPNTRKPHGQLKAWGGVTLLKK
ncbi:MAG TPA: hypothetical protein VMQ44_00995 [Candidatus Saccharimonadales bacterium]|nr:hypothetical protein [Candidatus Saccharimonadales bacterium]